MNKGRNQAFIKVLACILGVMGGCVGAMAQPLSPQLVVSPTRLTFYSMAGSAETMSKDVTLTGSPEGSVLQFTASVQLGNGWLSVGTPSSGATPSSLRVFVKVSGMSAGVYTGTIAVDAPGSTNSPVTLLVTLTLRNRTMLIARPALLNFSSQYNFKYAVPPPQTIAVLGDATRFSVTKSVNWVNVTPTSSTTPASLTVSVNTSGLGVGNYEGVVIIQSPDAVSWVFVPVKLEMTANPRLTAANPNSISLQAQYGSHQRLSETVSVYTNGDVFQISASAGTQWLSVETLFASAGSTDGKTGMVLPTPARVKIYADPTGLSTGTYSGTVSISRLGDESSSVSIPVTLQIGSNDLVVSQVADGAGWSTTIILVNTDSEPAPFTLSFYQQSGMPLVLPIQGLGRGREYAGTIPVGGIQILQTTGTDQTVSQGWAQVRAQRSIAGTAIFRQHTQSGDSEAAVLVAPALGKRFLLPFDEAEGFATGLAVVNTGLDAATVSVELRDENGARLESGSISLASRGQLAFMLQTTYPQIANRRGVAEFSCSTSDLSAVGLRFSPGGTFTSFKPALPETSDASVRTKKVAQIADGGGWKTTFVLVNSGTQPAPFAVVFKKADGTALSLPLPGIGVRQEYSDVIPAGGVRTLETEGTTNPSVDGWAEVVSSGPVAGTVVFAQKGSSASNSEGTVQLVPSLGEPAVLPFDNTLGFLTALALLAENDSEGPLLTVVVKDEYGQRLSTQYLQLKARTRQVSYLISLYPITADRRGSVEFEGARISMIGLRFNPMGSFTSIAPARK